MEELQDIIKISGDSYLENYEYSHGIVKLMLELDELDRKILISIKSSLMAFNVPEMKERVYRTCFIELTKLSDVLKSRNGIYFASEEFGKFMKEKRENLNLAYGLREKENQFIFSLSGSEKLVSLIVRNEDDISFQYLD